MKKSNKGFSLIELIIVIAIMAVLIAVLAPQYLKYVEKSKKSTDLSNLTTAVGAVDTTLADPDTISGTSITLTYSGQQFSVSDTTSGSNVATTWADTLGSNVNYVCKSKFMKAAVSITVTWTFNSSSSTWAKTCSSSDAEIKSACGC